MNDKPQPRRFRLVRSLLAGKRPAPGPAPTVEQPAAADEDGFDEPLNIPVPRKSAPLNIPWKQILVVGGLIVLVMTMLSLNSRLSEYARLKSERDSMATRIAGLYATKIVLETQLADVASDALVAQAARNAHMIRDGEKLLVVLTPPGNTPVAEETPSVEVTRTSPKPWDIWYDLFFGD